jgi:hypothetical protein
MKMSATAAAMMRVLNKKIHFSAFGFLRFPHGVHAAIPLTRK